MKQPPEYSDRHLPKIDIKKSPLKDKSNSQALLQNIKVFKKKDKSDEIVSCNNREKRKLVFSSNAATEADDTELLNKKFVKRPEMNSRGFKKPTRNSIDQDIEITLDSQHKIAYLRNFIPHSVLSQLKHDEI